MSTSDASGAVQHEAPVLFDEPTTKRGRRIGIATLNAPKVLNSLSLDMARLLDERLRCWADDEELALVVLQSMGDKAFCAGGDLHRLYRSMVEYRAGGQQGLRANAYASDFFAAEYRLDYRIHTYPKPVLCWGHGIVMGGGFGLMGGASHRVVTERSKLAFPEITIGLYPDSGGSWLLHGAASRGGLFLGLTGAVLDAADAIYAGVADWHIEERQRDGVFAALRDVPWTGSSEANADMLSELLRGYVSPIMPGPLQRQQAQIDALCSQPSLDAIVQAVSGLTTDDPWLARARDTLAAGAPGSARLTFELHQRASALSLAEMFRLEYLASLHCATIGDFAEGIRALLIDKDHQPHWQPAALAEATPAWADRFLQASWPEQEHPLAELDALDGLA